MKNEHSENNKFFYMNPEATPQEVEHQAQIHPFDSRESIRKWRK